VPSPHPFDPAKFPDGSRVRIAARPALEEFSRTWKFHHKLQSEQLDYAGRVAKVANSGMYHGGDIIYRLEDVPGMWHERCLALET
jgi:hypothetical protein